MKIHGFQWDSGNWPKCGKHGVKQIEVEEVFQGTPAVYPDPSTSEERLRVIGTSRGGRFVFVVFRFVEIGDVQLIRPISARFMHKKEIDHYERQTEN